MLELVAGPDRVLIDPQAGGRLVSMVAGGLERLLGPDGDSGAGPRHDYGVQPLPELLYGCFLMAPWPGRLAGAELEWQGRSYRLEPNWGPHAIHGVTFRRAMVRRRGE